METRRRDGHTILFLQVTDIVSRTYADYSDTDGAFFGMCEMFEETYKRKVKVQDVTYDISDVAEYFKSFADMMLMVYNEEMNHYEVHDSPWILERLLAYGERLDGQPQAAGAASADGDADEDVEEDWEL